jgi:hypothetical protein
VKRWAEQSFAVGFPGGGSAPEAGAEQGRGTRLPAPACSLQAPSRKARGGAQYFRTTLLYSRKISIGCYTVPGIGYFSIICYSAIPSWAVRSKRMICDGIIRSKL